PRTETPRSSTQLSRHAPESARRQSEKSPRWHKRTRVAPGIAGRAPARARTAGNNRSRGAARRRARPRKRGQTPFFENQGQTPFFENQGQTPFFSSGWQHPARRLAEADRRMALARAARALDHLVAVLDESPRFPARQLERRLAALGELEQRPARVRRRGGDGSRCDRVCR